MMARAESSARFCVIFNVAIALENPYGDDFVDLPLLEMCDAYNDALRSLALEARMHSPRTQHAGRRVGNVFMIFFRTDQVGGSLRKVWGLGFMFHKCWKQLSAMKNDRYGVNAYSNASN